MSAARFNIVICGCGPAGLAAALFLQRAGHQVVLLERFERPRPVGSGLILQPTGLAVLHELGLVQQKARLGAPIHRLFGCSVPAGRTVLDVRYHALRPGWHALGVHRAALFDVLHEAARQANIPIHPNIAVAAVTREGRRATVRDASARAIECADLVVDAMGACSPLRAAGCRRRALPYGALWANVPWPEGAFHAQALEQRYRAAHQMAGLLPIGRQHAQGASLASLFWSLRRDELAAFDAGGLERWRQQVLSLWPALEGSLGTIRSREQLSFARYEHFTLRRPWQQALVCIGDAARATSPQLGQGANMALLDAWALAQALSKADGIDAAQVAYGRLRAFHTQLFQAASRAFTPFYQSGSRLLPLVRDHLAAPIARIPALHRTLVRLVSGTLISPLRGVEFTARAQSALHVLDYGLPGDSGADQPPAQAHGQHAGDDDQHKPDERRMT